MSAKSHVSRLTSQSDVVVVKVEFKVSPLRCSFLDMYQLLRHASLAGMPEWSKGPDSSTNCVIALDASPKHGEISGSH